MILKTNARNQFPPDEIETNEGEFIRFKPLLPGGYQIELGYFGPVALRDITTS